MLGYLSVDIICSEKRPVSFEEQIMSKGKYPTIFLPHMEAIVFIMNVVPRSTMNTNGETFYIKNTPIHPYDTRARYGNCDLRVFSDALTLSDLCQPSEMFFNCFMKLNRSLGSPPFSGTLKFFVDFQGSGASTNTL